MALPEAKALIVVYITGGPDVKEAELNEWLDNNQPPALAEADGSTSAICYKAHDELEPSSATLYNATSVSVRDIAFKPQRNDKGLTEKDRDILSRISTIERRTYNLVYTHTIPSTPASTPGKYILVTSMTPDPAHDEEFGKWYDEEHMPLVAKVPGWLRGRRFKLEDFHKVKTDRPSAEAQKAGLYLAVHEFDRLGFIEAPEMKATMETPWSQRILGIMVGGQPVRVFEQAKVLKGPGM